MGNKTTSAQTWDWDVRVRERNLKAGLLSEKEVEKMLSSLEDLAEKADTVSLAQPALSSSAVSADASDIDDEEDDDDIDDDDDDDGADADADADEGGDEGEGEGGPGPAAGGGDPDGVEP